MKKEKNARTEIEIYTEPILSTAVSRFHVRDLCTRASYSVALLFSNALRVTNCSPHLTVSAFNVVLLHRSLPCLCLQGTVCGAVHVTE